MSFAELWFIQLDDIQIKLVFYSRWYTKCIKCTSFNWSKKFHESFCFQKISQLTKSRETETLFGSKILWVLNFSHYYKYLVLSLKTIWSSETFLRDVNTEPWKKPLLIRDTIFELSPFGLAAGVKTTLHHLSRQLTFKTHYLLDSFCSFFVKQIIIIRVREK
jgi:hypothetical protein